jgi:hypothetical protein
MPDYICPLCQTPVDLSEGLPDPDIEIIDDIPVHGECVILLYNAHKNEISLTSIEKKIMKRREG